MSEATQTEKKQAQKERKAYRAKKRKLFFKTLFSRKIVLVDAGHDCRLLRRHRR